jgi:hypothetical protein
MSSSLRIPHAVVLVSTLALSMVGPRAALAAEAADDSVEQAKRHFTLGVTFYKDGDLDAALAEFNKAYETRADYRVLYNIGQVQAERHDYAASMKAMRRYLKDGGREIDEARRVAVDQALRDMSKRVAAVTVTANEPGAEILVDGVAVAVTPTSEALAVNAGIREITVRKGGETATAQRLTLAGGDAVRLDFSLGAGGLVGRPMELQAQPLAAPLRARVWIAYGAAAALAAGAVTFGLLARRAQDDLDADLGRFPGDRAQIDQDRDRLKLRAGLTDGFGGAALIAAALGTYFLFSGPTATESAPSASPSAQVSLLPSGAALSLSGTF